MRYVSKQLQFMFNKLPRQIQDIIKHIKQKKPATIVSLGVYQKNHAYAH